LGNQLFQNDLGRQLAIRRRAELFFDASWYSTSNAELRQRRLSLCEFKVTGEVSSDNHWEPAWLPSSLGAKVRWKIEQRFSPLHWRKFVQEDLCQYKRQRKTFNPKILNVPRDVYLFGWWNSPRY